MTRDQIAAEKVALQKALLYYESIHGRPVCTAAFFFKVHLYMSLSLVSDPPNAPLTSQSLELLAVQTTRASSNPPP